ncbi:MAG: hypothetical protein OEM52_06740 [bacterium]|nr:hypothetical protein [bacterium]
MSFIKQSRITLTRHSDPFRLIALCLGLVLFTSLSYGYGFMTTVNNPACPNASLVDIQVANDGYIFICGQGVIGYTPEFGMSVSSWFITKTNQFGETIWTYTPRLDTLINRYVTSWAAASIFPTSDGGCVLSTNANTMTSDGSGQIVKLNPQGLLEWERQLSANLSTGDITQMSNGDYIVFNSYQLKKLSSSGIYTNSYPQLNASQITKIRELESFIFSSGQRGYPSYSYFVSRQTLTTTDTLTCTGSVHFDDCSFLLRNSQAPFYRYYDAAFNLVWSRETWLGNNFNGECSDQFTEAENADFIQLSGTRLFKYTTNGDTLWTRELRYRDTLRTFSQLRSSPDGGFILANTANNVITVAKADSNGTLNPSQAFVAHPNGAEILQIGQVDTIRWSSYNITGSVNLELKRNYPNGVWEMIAANIPNSGSYPWLVNGAVSNNCMLRVSSVSDPSARDYSDYSFSIVQPVIQLTSPTGTDSLLVDSYTTIQWNSVSTTGNVRIDINRNYPSDSWETLFSSITNMGEQLWHISGPTTTTARIRVMALNNPTVGDTSEYNFTIYGNFSGLYVYLSTQNISFNTMIAPSMRDSINVTVRVMGNQPMLGARAITLSGPFRCAPTNLPAVPAGYTTMFTVYFEPTTEGVFTGTVALVSTALNADTLRITCTGTAQWQPAVPRNLTITLQGWNAILNWSRVDSTMNGVPITVTGYIIYYSELSSGPWFFHGYTSGANSTSYIHNGVTHFSPVMYYRVRAWIGSGDSLDEFLVEMPIGTPELEVEQYLKKTIQVWRPVSTQ